MTRAFDVPFGTDPCGTAAEPRRQAGPGVTLGKARMPVVLSAACVPEFAPTLSELPMSYRWSPQPRWPAAQVESVVSAGGAGPGVLDAASLDRLRELDPGARNGLLNRVLRTYTQSLERTLVQWGQAQAAGDAVAMRGMAHTLKSSSASVGALELSALCAAVEARLRDQGLSGAEPQLCALAVEVQRVLAGLSAGYGTQP